MPFLVYEEDYLRLVRKRWEVMLKKNIVAPPESDEFKPRSEFELHFGTEQKTERDIDMRFGEPSSGLKKLLTRINEKFGGRLSTLVESIPFEPAVSELEQVSTNEATSNNSIHRFKIENYRYGIHPNAKQLKILMECQDNWENPYERTFEFKRAFGHTHKGSKDELLFGMVAHLSSSKTWRRCFPVDKLKWLRLSDKMAFLSQKWPTDMMTYHWFLGHSPPHETWTDKVLIAATKAIYSFQSSWGFSLGYTDSHSEGLIKECYLHPTTVKMFQASNESYQENISAYHKSVARCSLRHYSVAIHHILQTDYSAIGSALGVSIDVDMGGGHIGAGLKSSKGSPMEFILGYSS